MTIVAPGEQGFVSGDASRWTPWGGYLTAEESWGSGSVKGRLFEVTNPITAGPNGGNFVWRRSCRASLMKGWPSIEQHLVFRRRAQRRVDLQVRPTHPNASTGDEYFDAGQTFVLKVGAGGQFEGNSGTGDHGEATWVAITDATGGPIPGVSITLPDGTIDGRVSADDSDVLATG